MTADSSANHHSPPISSSPDCVKTFPSMWAKVVRGEPETTSITPLSASISPPLPSVSAPVQDFSDYSVLKAQSLSPLENSANQLAGCDVSNGNAGLSQKPAWKPLAETDSSPGPVIDGSGWPALAKPTRPSRKSLKPSSEGSSVPAPNSQGQRSMKRGGDTGAGGVSAYIGTAAEGGSAAEGVSAQDGTAAGDISAKSGIAAGSISAESGTAAEGVSAESGSDQPPPPPPPFPRVDTANNGTRVREPSYRGNNNWEARPMGGGGGGLGSRLHDHSSHRMNSSRRANGGPRLRGGLNGGVYHHNHNGYGGGNRHDHHDHHHHHHQDHRNNWNASRGPNARNVHLPHTMGPPPPPPPPPYRGFIRPTTPPQGSSPFIPPQHVRPFGNPMGLDMAPSPFIYGPPLPPETYWPMPLDSHPSPPQPPIFLPLMGPPLATSLVNQIDFYFSDANLLTDGFLKKNMDAQGWVPISLIAGFRRVKNMTNNIELILNSLRASNVVEVQGDKVRRRNDWRRWVWSSFGQPNSTSMTTSLQNIALENSTSDVNSAVAVDTVDESLKEGTEENAP